MLRVTQEPRLYLHLARIAPLRAPVHPVEADALLAELRDDLREHYLRRTHRGVEEDGLLRLPVDGGSGRVDGIQRTFQYQPPHNVLQRWEDDTQLADVRVVCGFR